MKTTLDVAVPAVTFLVMTIVGLDLTRADFARVKARPRVFAAGLVGPLVALPPVALAVLRLVPMPEEIAAGLLLLAVAITLLGDTRFAVFATTYFFTESALILVAVAAFRRAAMRAGRQPSIIRS